MDETTLAMNDPEESEEGVRRTPLYLLPPSPDEALRRILPPRDGDRVPVAAFNASL